VVHRPGGLEVPDYTNSDGPTCAWLRKFSVRSSTCRFFIVSVFSLSLNFEFFQASFIREDADEKTSNRHLEAYLLWLFGYVMFCGSQGDAVSRLLTPTRGGLPTPPWRTCPRSTGCCGFGRDVQGLCTGCTKTGTQSILLEFSLLLHLWSYKRLPVGRPSVDRSPCRALEEGHNPTNRPTMGSMWCQH
jgi:hypothetical protein